MTDGPTTGTTDVENDDGEGSEDYTPRHARAEEAAETPAHADAERMEAALREGGPLGPADDYAAERAAAPTEDGPGTSLA